VENASGTTYNNYFQQKIRDRIGMNGFCSVALVITMYCKQSLSMARFGFLMLNKGKWDQATILSDSNYFNAQVNTSQNYNLSYGYLTWLNGKATHMLPQTQLVFNGNLIPTAPADLYAALGKNDQKVYVVPSPKLVVIRMGESAGNVQLAISSLIRNCGEAEAGDVLFFLFFCLDAKEPKSRQNEWLRPFCPPPFPDKLCPFTGIFDSLHTNDEDSAACYA
jgi:CubicO group peptidase (beta-lactamase class C family)